MPEPLYYLQLVDRDGKTVTGPMRPLKQRHGCVELPIIEDVLARVGWWRTKAKLRDALHASIQSLKDEARFVG